MKKQRIPPGKMRDTIAHYLKSRGAPARVSEILAHANSVFKDVFGEVSRSSVQSSLNLQPMFRRVGKGLYILDDEGPR